MRKFFSVLVIILASLCCSISVNAQSALLYFDTVTDINSTDEKTRIDFYTNVEISAKKELFATKYSNSIPQADSSSDSYAYSFKTVKDIIRAANASSV